MARASFTEKMKGKVIEHTLGFHATVVEMDPAREGDSHWSSNWAYCRYHHIKNGELEIRSFAAWEFKALPEEDEGD